MFKKYMKKVLAFTLAGALAFSGAQIAGVGGADVASAAATANWVTTGATVDASSVGVAAYKQKTAYTTGNKTELGYLFVEPGKTIILHMAYDGEANVAKEAEVMAAPKDWTVKVAKVAANGADVKVTITAPTTASSYDWTSENIIVTDGTNDLRLIATNGTYSQEIKGKASVDLPTSAGDVAINDQTNSTTIGNSFYKKYAELTGLNATGGTWSANEDLQKAAAIKNGGVDATNFTDVAFANDTTIAAKADKAGTSGVLTFKNPKAEVSFAGGSGLTTKKVEVSASSLDVKVNVQTAVTKGNDGVKIGCAADTDIPFKALIDSSTDVTATEVKDVNGTALPSATGKVKIDNDKKIITAVAGKTGAVYIKFAPKDSNKSGTGVVVTLTLAGGASKQAVLAPGKAIATDAATQGTLTIDPTVGGGTGEDITPASDDTWRFKFYDDAIDGMFTVAPMAYNATSLNVTPKNGVPAGTYKGVLTFNDDDGLLYFQEVSVVVLGEAKDLPANIGINKINGTKTSSYTDVAALTGAGKVTPNTIGSRNYTAAGTGTASDVATANNFKNANILSGSDATITISSLIIDAKTVKDVQIGQVQLEDAGTGARITDGVTFDGLDVKIAADKLAAGKRYYLFVTTKGTGISESDSMSKANAIWIDVLQGYKFNYNYGGATVKAGKTVADVSISSDSAKPKLEDGSNLDFAGASFLGWSYTEGATKADITAADAKEGLNAAQVKAALDKQVNALIQVYAVWDYTKYTMSFDANGGTGTEQAKAFTVATTDLTLPAAGFANTNKPLIGWSTSATGKTAAGATLPVYSGTLNMAQLQAIVTEVDSTAKTAAIKMYAQYGAALKSVAITPATLTLEAGKTGTLTATATDENGATMTTPVITFKSDNEGVATVDANGVVTAVAEGTANITATATLGNVAVTSTATVVTVTKKVKKANPIKVTAKKVTIKAGKSAKISKALTIKSAKGTKTFAKKSGSKNITVNKKTGKIKVKKGTKAKTYKIKISVKAAGNSTYKAKTVTKTVKVVVK